MLLSVLSELETATALVTSHLRSQRMSARERAAYTNGLRLRRLPVGIEARIDALIQEIGYARQAIEAG